MTDLSGQTLKGYVLQEEIGTGAYGAVYRAYQPQVGREVAIKVIHPEHANRPEFIRRFELDNARDDLRLRRKLSPSAGEWEAAG